MRPRCGPHNDPPREELRRKYHAAALHLARATRSPHTPASQRKAHLSHVVGTPAEQCRAVSPRGFPKGGRILYLCPRTEDRSRTGRFVLSADARQRPPSDRQQAEAIPLLWGHHYAACESCPRMSSSYRRIMRRDPGRSARTRQPFHGLGGRRYCNSSRTPHIMGHGSRWPAKTRGPSHGLGRAAYIKPHLMGRAAARPIKMQVDGLRPGPTHQIFISWAAARPGPSNF